MYSVISTYLFYSFRFLLYILMYNKSYRWNTTNERIKNRSSLSMGLCDEHTIPDKPGYSPQHNIVDIVGPFVFTISDRSGKFKVTFETFKSLVNNGTVLWWLLYRSAPTTIILVICHVDIEAIIIIYVCICKLLVF